MVDCCEVVEHIRKFDSVLIHAENALWNCLRFEVFCVNKCSCKFILLGSIGIEAYLLLSNLIVTVL